METKTYHATNSKAKLGRAFEITVRFPSTSDATGYVRQPRQTESSAGSMNAERRGTLAWGVPLVTPGTKRTTQQPDGFMEHLDPPNQDIGFLLIFYARFRYVLVKLGHPDKLHVQVCAGEVRIHVMPATLRSPVRNDPQPHARALSKKYVALGPSNSQQWSCQSRGCRETQSLVRVAEVRKVGIHIRSTLRSAPSGRLGPELYLLATFPAIRLNVKQRPGSSRTGR